jgi:branched-chain amino acid transport system ATP-binding protein
LRPILLPGKEREIRERARAAAGKVAISHKLHEIVGNLSHGEQRQVAIAMALAAEPKALMLDEPASGLSRGERQLLTELLLGLDRDITLILIEHDMDIALNVAEQVTMMHDGVIVEGTPDEIRANETARLYLGGATAMSEAVAASRGPDRHAAGDLGLERLRSARRRDGTSLWGMSRSRPSGVTAC